MTDLELLGLDKLEEEIKDAFQRVQDKEEGRQEHLRIFTKGSLERALRIIKMLRENNTAK